MFFIAGMYDLSQYYTEMVLLQVNFPVEFMTKIRQNIAREGGAALAASPCLLAKPCALCQQTRQIPKTRWDEISPLILH
jgi:hypothetical protein